MLFVFNFDFFVRFSHDWVSYKNVIEMSSVLLKVILSEKKDAVDFIVNFPGRR